MVQNKTPVPHLRETPAREEGGGVLLKFALAFLRFGVDHTAPCSRSSGSAPDLELRIGFCEPFSVPGEVKEGSLEHLSGFQIADTEPGFGAGLLVGNGDVHANATDG